MVENPLTLYRYRSELRVEEYKDNKALQQAYRDFNIALVEAKYAYNFFYLGVPILQMPQDLQALQEIIWYVKPTLIIETGIAMGGSLIFSAAMLTLLESCNKIEKGHVLGIDIDIRPHNEEAIRTHPLTTKITMFEGSSIDEDIITRVRGFAKDKNTILVCLDSNHTHEHVLAELRAYAPLVSVGSYIMVADTGIEDLPEGLTSDRPWGKGNNPKTAVYEFLKENSDFEIDKNIHSKLILTCAHDGFLRRRK